MNLATFTAAVLLLGVIPRPDGVLRDECGCIEVNHIFDAEGKEYLCQYLFWDWCQHKGCHRVADWKLVKSDARPRYDYSRRCYVLRIKEGEQVREITAPTARETWRTWDEELEDRNKHDFNHRRKLSTGVIERSVLVERRWTE